MRCALDSRRLKPGKYVVLTRKSPDPTPLPRIGAANQCQKRQNHANRTLRLGDSRDIQTRIPRNPELRLLHNYPIPDRVIPRGDICNLRFRYLIIFHEGRGNTNW